MWIFSERMPGDSSSPLICPPELHRSGFGCAPADPSRCAAVADGASVYPRRIFDSGLRYDETYPFGGLWYLWGKLLACHGWHISFSDRTFVWHHFWPDSATPDDGRLENRAQLRQQLLATTYVQFVGALWLDRSPIQVGWAAAYGLRRLLVPGFDRSFPGAHAPLVRWCHARALARIARPALVPDRVNVVEDI